MKNSLLKKAIGMIAPQCPSAPVPHVEASTIGLNGPGVAMGILLSHRANFLYSVLVGFILVLTGLSASAQSSVNLRLMPIGDSITSGFQSTTANGYRGPLRAALVAQVATVDFVGSIQDGKMADADHEGHSGYRIDQIAPLLNGALNTYRPNIITLHIGTNDMNQGYQLAGAPARLAVLIE